MRIIESSRLSERERESVIELLDEDANRRVELSSFKSPHCCKSEKRVVLAGRREIKQIIFKDPLCVFMKIFFVSHEMCRKRAKEREREANNFFYCFPLNKFQLLFNLERDALSFSLSRPMRNVSFHIT